MVHTPLSAVRCVVFTVDPTEAWRAGTSVAVHTIGAIGTIEAGAAGTLIDVLCTEGALEARQAGTRGRVDTVSAGATIVAWVCRGTGGGCMVGIDVHCREQALCPSPLPPILLTESLPWCKYFSCPALGPQALTLQLGQEELSGLGLA